MKNNNIIDLKNFQPKKKNESIEIKKHLAELEQQQLERQKKIREEAESVFQEKEEKKIVSDSSSTPKNVFRKTFSSQTDTAWLKMGRFFLFSLIFLLPLFFLPITIYPVDANKQFLAVLLISVSLLCYLVNSYFSRKIVYSRSMLSVSVVFFVIVGGLSALFSVSPNTSFYGNFTQADVFINFIVYGLALYLAIVLFKKEDFNKIGIIFLTSTVLISILSLFQLFGMYIFPYDFAAQVGFNVFGSIINFDIYIAFGLVLIVAALTELNVSLKTKIGLVFAGLLMTLNLILINYQPIWVLLMIVMVIYAIYKFTFKAEGDRSSLVGLSVPLLIGIIAFLFAMVSPSLPKIMDMPDIPIDIKPNFSSTIDISKNALEGSRILTGTGLATFSLQYNAYRPVELNQSNFWQIKFNQGFSFVSTYLVTAGILGILSILFIIFAFARLAAKNIDDKRSMVVSVGILFMILGWFYFPSSYVSFLFSFVALGFLIVLDSDLKEIDFSHAKKHYIAASFLIIFIFAAGATSLFYISGKKYVAAFYFQTGLKKYNSGDVVESMEDISKAISLDQDNDQYLRSASQLMIVDAQNSRDPNVELDEDNEFQGKIADSVKLAKRATEINPAEAENWYNLGNIYEKIINIADGADSFAQINYHMASELNPKDPNPLIGEAKILMFMARQAQDSQINKEKINSAIDALEKAVELKSNYAAAHFQLGLAYMLANRSDDAIRELEFTRTLANFDASMNFQLGMMYYNNNDLDKAKTEMENAVDLDSDFSNARYVLGLIYDKKGEKNNAISQFESVLELNPDNDEVKEILNNLRTKGSAFVADEPVLTPPVDQPPLDLPESDQTDDGLTVENPVLPIDQVVPIE